MVQSKARAARMAAQGLAQSYPQVDKTTKKKPRKGKQARQRSREEQAQKVMKVAEMQILESTAGDAKTESCDEVVINGNKQVVCKDCGSEFSFSANEQSFYVQMGFDLSSKVRCADCTKIKKDRYGLTAGAPAHCYNCGKNGHLSRACPEAQRPTCYHCGQEGHMSRECPQWTQEMGEIKCFNCGKTGHVAANCREDIAVSTSATTKKNSASSISSKRDETCKAFLSAGGCQRGDKCRFNHPLGVSRTVAASPSCETVPSSKGSSSKKDETCKAFLSAGGCQRGDKCRFNHPLGASSPVAAPSTFDTALSSKGPSSKKPETCKAFLSAGGCQRGDKCRFSHSA